MKSLKIFISSLFLFLTLVRPNVWANDCVNIFNKLGCGYNVECIMKKQSSIPSQCSDQYQAWLEKAYAQTPCEQEKRKYCKDGKCDAMAFNNLSNECKKKYNQNQKMEASANKMVKFCTNDFKTHCQMELKDMADKSKSVNCLTKQKSKFSKNCQEAINQMFNGAI